MSTLDTMPIQTASGLAVRQLGDGPVVVLLHGIPGSSGIWSAVADDLAIDHRVVVPDLLGFGASARPAALEELHAEAQADALDRCLDELGIDTAVVIGHDFGGPTAVTLSLRHPERVSGIGVMSTNLFTDTPIPFPLSVVNWPVIGTLSRPVMFGRTSQAMLLHRAVGRPRMRADHRLWLGDSRQVRAVATILAESLRHLDTLYADIEAHVHRIDIPRFVAWGDRDPLFPIEQAERAAAALRVPLFRLADAGHFLPLERPMEVTGFARRLAAEVYHRA
jgi:pimeloyl-ACP methyl ester carboxylesterase